MTDPVTIPVTIPPSADRPDRTTPRARRLVGTTVAAFAVLAMPLATLPADAAPTPRATTATPAATPAATTAATAAAIAGAAQETAPLTNLDHLDWLGDTVTPPTQAGHTTYRLADAPSIGTLWTYAEPLPAGGFRHVGGGEYDPETDTWGQGAYNADDMSRAAVVYLRHWRATGTVASRHAAHEMLRGLTYLQTANGPDAGNVVLWMQPDGTLNPSAEPVELPDPSDSDASYWLARTIWALGEGYAAFRDTDPEFAGFLRDRLDLAIDAVDRQVLDRFGEYLDIDGKRTPAWLIADGADASAEAVLGLAAYVDAGGPRTARTALSQLSKGIAALSSGSARSWPFGAVRPWALSRSMWHGWGAQMPAALSRASTSLDAPRLARVARVAAKDSFTFDPWLLTSGGPDNGRMPTRGDRSQIAYGADSRVQSLVATLEGAGSRGARSGVRSGARRLAGMFGAWFFGANPAGEPMYDPAAGTTYDGISADGTINKNSGAESTIHGLLTMLALDQHPRVASLARTATVERRVGTTILEAEDATLRGTAEPVAPDEVWTGESLFSGTGFAALGRGGSATFALPAHRRSLLLPVFDLEPGSSAVTTFHANRASGRPLGTVRSGAVGAQGDSPAPGLLLPVTLRRSLPAGVSRVTTTTTAKHGDRARLDALLLEPMVSRLVLSGNGHGTALLSSRSGKHEHARVVVPGRGRARVESYTGSGRLVTVRSSHARRVPVTLRPGGFTVVRR